MSFLNKLSTIFEVEVERKTIFVFAILLTSLGVISAIEPSYTLIILGGFTLLLLVILNPKEAFLITGISLIFQTAIVKNLILLGSPEKITNLINRTDEVIWAFFIGYLLLHNYKGNTWKFQKTNLESIAIIFCFIGILSTFLNHNSVLWSSVSIFLALKGFFMYWISKNLSLDEHKVVLFFKIILYTLVITAIIGILQYFGVQIFTLSGDERFGIKLASSIFGHHGTFGSLMGAGIALSFGLKLGTKNNKWLYITYIFAFGLLASTVRRSMVGITLGILFVMLFYRKFRISKKYAYYSLGIIILTFIIFYGRFSNLISGTQEEYGTNIHPRYILYYGAFKIIKNKPLSGEGPGTYASYVSIVIKSKIYQKYKIMIPDKFKTDTFWAMILGEYGIPGTITFGLLLLSLFRILLISFPKDDNNPFLKGLHVGYIILFVDYFSESFLTPIYSKSLYSFIFFAGIGLLVNLNKQTLENQSAISQ